MPERDSRVDDYIAGVADFAQPVLRKLRQLVHKACPAVEETMKWSFPHFEYKGILCSMASFKHHCSFSFWKAAAMKDPHGILHKTGESGMGNLGKLKSLGDLPEEGVLISYIKHAASLNDEGSKHHSPKPRSGIEFKIPQYFLKALKKNQKAFATFESFSPSNKRDYVEWIVEAKTEKTRQRRLATAIEWMAGGKIRNWKYARVRR
jgi:uncharacterized protein YdeI (YjbR/CyaY-like superfamily)